MAKKRVKPNKILILGGTGSGKSTLAREISKITGLPYIGLDWLAYKKPWTVRYSNKIITKRVEEVVKKRKWIMEGSYTESWMNLVMKEADIIILLNLPRRVLMRRVFSRYIKNQINKELRGKEKFKHMLTLLRFSFLYKNNTFYTHKNRAEKHCQELIILKNKKEINEFLRSLK